MDQVKAIRLCVPMATYELLQKAAKDAKCSEELFAEICINSVIAKYAKHIEPITEPVAPEELPDEL